VPTETPAYAATSLMLTGALATMSLPLLCRKCAVIHWNVSNRSIPAAGGPQPRVGDASRAGRECGPARCVSSAVRRRQGRYREVM
jgi:hypothetical protein